MQFHLIGIFSTNLNPIVSRELGPEVFPDDDVATGVDEGFILGLFACCCPKAHVRDTWCVGTIVHRVPEELVSRERGDLTRFAAAEYIDSQR